MARVGGHFAERLPPRRAQPLEAGELGLDGDARRPSRVDQRAAVNVHGDGRAPCRRGVGARARGGVARSRPQRLRVGVEAEHDLRLPLRDALREHVAKPRASAVVSAFSRCRAMNRGTPGGIWMRSPSRVHPGWHGAPLNLLNPARDLATAAQLLLDSHRVTPAMRRCRSARSATWSTSSASALNLLLRDGAMCRRADRLAAVRSVLFLGIAIYDGAGRAANELLC